MSKPIILVVDDEQDILELLKYNLEKSDFEVYTAGDGVEALGIVEAKNPDLIILDIMMPKMDGVETCRRVREMENGKNIFIIFLTARSEEFTEIAGFDAGADDFIAKPIRPRALISRINAILRRTGDNANEGEILIHDLKICPDEFYVYRKNKKIRLPKKEFMLLHYLASKPGKVFTREKLLKKIWGSDVLVVDRTIDVHIRKLREKLGKKYIETIKGVGYKFLK